MFEFKFSTSEEYLKELTVLLSKNFDEEIYNDLMDEFMYFCEVSGSVKRSF